jgi:hypothetical protein
MIAAGNGAYDDDETVTHRQMRLHVMSSVEPVRAEVREQGDRVASAVHGVHALTMDLQRQIQELVETCRSQFALHTKLHKRTIARVDLLHAKPAKKRRKPKRRRK